MDEQVQWSILASIVPRFTHAGGIGLFSSAAFGSAALARIFPGLFVKVVLCSFARTRKPCAKRGRYHVA
ncbi:hypothetical protein [Marilutibacter alkalisoli]|uniref:Uncharacterized protein n=1 Tax=Marilutibacter alkalisoli TaxID=2591633 RepID=A0A514BUQ9_9GAMM|nr:hypothetical protein [Lysobacter alkalisoli]QDH71134.1 hypothetical protein FKV23_14340 [Lysobacter alkalisoli]